MLRQDLMLDWQTNDIFFKVDFFDIIKVFLSWCSECFAFFKCLYGFVVTHFVNIGFTWTLGVYQHFWFERHLVTWILILHADGCWLIELTFESDVEIGNLSFQNIGHRMGIRNYTLDYILVIVYLHSTNDSGEWIIEELYDLLGRVFMVLDEDLVPFSFLGTAFD